MPPLFSGAGSGSGAGGSGSGSEDELGLDGDDFEGVPMTADRQPVLALVLTGALALGVLVLCLVWNERKRRE